MAVYVVTWNLNREVNYNAKRTAFLNNLNGYENFAEPGLETVRWISTDLSPEALTDDLIRPLDSNDRLFLTRLTAGSYQGWMNEPTWEWIRRRL